MSDGEVVVFDLDGVLSRRDTMATLVAHALRRRPGATVVVAGLLLATLVLPRTGRARPRLHRTIVAVALRGTDAAAYAALVEAACADLSRRPGNLPPHAAAAFARHGAASAVVVCTASEATMARRYLSAVGLDGAVVVASALVFTPRGARIATHNVGAAKVVALRAHTIAAVERVYTDSVSDLPLVSIARSAVAVNASRRAFARMRGVSAAVRPVRW